MNTVINIVAAIGSVRILALFTANEGCKIGLAIGRSGQAELLVRYRTP